MSNPAPRRKPFGPLLYSTLFVAILVAGYTLYIKVETYAMEWREAKQIETGLHSNVRQERDRATTNLFSISNRHAESILLAALADPKPEVRLNACRALIHFGAPMSRVLPTLLTASTDSRDEIREEAAVSFGEVMQSAWFKLGPQLASEDPAREAEIAQCRTQLAQLLRDRAVSVRIGTANVLTNQGRGTQELIKELEAATSDSDSGVRFAAARAILLVQGARSELAVRTLIALLVDLDSSVDHYQIVALLRQAGNATLARATRAIIERMARADQVELPELIGYIRLIGGEQARAALPVLRGFVTAGDRLSRSSAAEAIVELEGPESPQAIAIVSQTVGDPELDESQRMAALQSLAEVDRVALSKTAKALVQQLGDPDSEVRRVASMLLGQLVLIVPADLTAAAPRP